MQMTFSNLESAILTQVIERPRELPDFLDKCLKKGISRAGFYKALSRLKRDEVVLVKDRVISVNRAWLAKGYQFFEHHMGTANLPSYFGEQVAKLGKGEHLSYSFRSIEELDIFLINLIYDLLRLGIGKDVLIQERHEFFFALDETRTNHIVREFDRIGSKLYLLAESNSEIDRAVIKRLPKSAHVHATGSERRDTFGKIFHAVGDVLIELRLDKGFAQELDKLYAHETTNDRFLKSLAALVAKRRRHVLRIYRDKERARAMQSRFKKYFVM